MSSISKILHIRLSGYFELRIDENLIVIDSKAARVVLIYVALQRSHRVDRDHLASIIWPDMDRDRARSNLRQSFHFLKRSLANVSFAGLIIDRQFVSLLSDSFVTDIHELKQSLKQGEPIPSILLEGDPIGGTILVDFKVNDLLQDWVSLRRTEIQHDLQSLLRKNLGKFTDHELISDTCRALLIQDRGDELACRTMMKLQYDAGESAEALRYYSTLWEYLRDEFDIEPSEKTKDLALSINRGIDIADPHPVKANDTASTTVSIDSYRPTISVGPFELEALEPAMKAIVRGFRSELMSRLAKFREWRVLDGDITTNVTTSRDYRLPVVAIQNEDKTRISLSLIRETSNEIIWSETYGTFSTQWAQILTDTVSKISGATNINISRGRLVELSGQETSTANGFDAWLIGQRLLFTFRENNWQSAARLFKRLIEQEPNFTRAYTSLAQLNNIKHLAFPGILPNPEAITESVRLANTAIAIDPIDCQAHLCKAWSNIMLGDHQGAAYAYKTARELNPYDPWTTLSSALGESFCGNYELANHLAERSIKMGWTIEPAHWGYHATIRYLGSDYEGCLDACLNAGNVFYNIAAWRAASMARLRNITEAKKVFKEYINVCTENWRGTDPCAAESVLHWTISSFPIKDSAAKTSFRSALMSCIE